MSIAANHIQRLRTSLLRRGSMASLADWIEKNTYIGGRPYSYKDHEYQKAILEDTSLEVNTRKCSQVGVSEASARLALAAVNVVRPFTVIYTLPTAHFGSTFMRTRVDTVIQGSPVMRESIHRSNDNSEVKQFGDSFVYVKGASSSNAPISIPADMLIHDEVDFSSLDVLAQYVSRLTHSPWKLIRRFSTPTVPKYGIDKHFRESRRFFNLCQCNHCNHWFLPDYYKHVVIPGYSKKLEEVTKADLGVVAWDQAKLLCPRCGRVPSLQAQHRAYVCENEASNLTAAAYQVSPFDAPNIIKISDLVRASTNYTKRKDFVNFNLGLPMDDAESTLLISDFDDMFIDARPTGTVNVMGIDVGNTYHVLIGAVDGFGHITVTHAEKVPMGLFRSRFTELKAMFRPVATVIDSGPHAETVMSLQAVDPTIYASVFSTSKNIQTHVTVDKPEDEMTGTTFVRQLNVNRNRSLDTYMEFIRAKQLKFVNTPLQQEIIDQHLSMKRVMQFDPNSGEEHFTWVKTDGEDHFHLTGMYLWLAAKIKRAARPQVQLPLFSAMSLKLESGAL